jgi:hypothetical protein
MNTSSFANLYFSNVLNHVDALKQEEALLNQRRTWTNHTTQASNANATCCCCVDCTWVYFRCLTLKCCCKKKIDGKMSVSHKIAVFESDNKGDSVCFGCCHTKLTDRSVADVTGPPTMVMQTESKDMCCKFCVISRDEYEITIPTSLGVYEVGLISDLATALSGLWPAWKVLGSAPFMASEAKEMK